MTMLWFKPVSRLARRPSSEFLGGIQTMKSSQPPQNLIMRDHSNSSSITTILEEGDQAKKVDVEETRPNMKICLRVKSGDKFVSNNNMSTITADDLVEEKGKRVLQEVGDVEETRPKKKVRIKGGEKHVSNVNSAAEKYVNASSSKEEQEKQADEQEIISTVEEVRSDTKTRVISNKSTADDVAPASSNEEEKEKPMETNLASPSNLWNLRPRGSSHRVLNDKKRNPVLGTQDSSDEKKKYFERKPAEKRKVFISLTRQEIDDDFLQMTAGTKLSPPKKTHTQDVKKVLDHFFPGWKFNGKSAHTYKIPKR